jgi:tetratricopeptide (TPR) repeat protein
MAINALTYGMMTPRRWLAAGLLATGLLGAVQAQQGRPATATAEPALTHVDGLGSIAFPNSGKPAAQPAFVRGVLLLHSFEYDAAADAFRLAESADPAFALAYWGEAMTFNHPLWQQQDRDAAIKALAKLAPTPEARAARAPTPREKGYVAAVEALYGEGSKHDRDAAYMRAMERLSAEAPGDMEARAFYALSILGSRDGVRDFATYMRAAATVQPVLDANPDHPGAAHYLIHSFDDPIHAPLGLPAARRYSQIAPAAAHAQHMTSHIFVAMGLWSDVVSANVRATTEQDADNSKRGLPPNVCGHYTSWLQYGYLMLGDSSKAARLLDACFARMSAKPSNGEIAYFASMRARQVLDTRDWSLASRWTFAPPLPADGRMTRARLDYDFTNAFSALMRGDAAPASAMLVAPASADPALAPYRLELAGLVAIAGGRTDAGVELLRAAAQSEDAMPFEFGPPAIVKPTFELLGEQLLALGRTAEARAAFERAAERTPGRATLPGR